MSSYTRQQLEKWLKSIKVEGGVVGDIGGAQNPIKKRLKSFKSADYFIVDLATPHKGERPDAIVDLNLESSVISMGEKFADKNGNGLHKFDTAFCIEVMEYIYDPVAALWNINDMMKRGGVLYITFPFIYPVHEPVKSDYLRYTLEGVRKLLDECEFDIMDVYCRTTEDVSMQSVFASEKMKAAKNYNHENVAFNIKAKKRNR